MAHSSWKLGIWSLPYKVTGEYECVSLDTLMVISGEQGVAEWLLGVCSRRRSLYLETEALMERGRTYKGLTGGRFRLNASYACHNPFLGSIKELP